MPARSEGNHGGLPLQNRWTGERGQATLFFDTRFRERLLRITIEKSRMSPFLNPDEGRQGDSVRAEIVSGAAVREVFETVGV